MKGGRNKRRAANKQQHANKKPLIAAIVCTVCGKGDGK